LITITLARKDSAMQCNDNDTVSDNIKYSNDIS